MVGFWEAGSSNIFLLKLLSYMQDSPKTFHLLGILNVQSQQSVSSTPLPKPLTPTHSTLLWSTPSDRLTERHFLHPSIFPQLKDKVYPKDTADTEMGAEAQQSWTTHSRPDSSTGQVSQRVLQQHQHLWFWCIQNYNVDEMLAYC